jgi:hypothetical protein
MLEKGGASPKAPAWDGKAGGGSGQPLSQIRHTADRHYQTGRFFRCSDARRNLTAAVALRFGVLHVSTLMLAEAPWARCWCSLQLPSRSCGWSIGDR